MKIRSVIAAPAFAKNAINPKEMQRFPIVIIQSEPSSASGLA